MPQNQDIPREALKLEYNSSGFLPDVGLHRKGELIYQESSYWHLGLGAVILIIAVIISLLHWDTPAAFYGFKLKYLAATFCLFCALCASAPYFIRNMVGKTVIIDPQERTLRIKERTEDWSVTWAEIVALQICHEISSGDSEHNGCQLNLVWKDSKGIIRRRCLRKHAVKRFIAALADRYVTLFGFSLIDDSKRE